MSTGAEQTSDRPATMGCRDTRVLPSIEATNGPASVEYGARRRTHCLCVRSKRATTPELGCSARWVFSRLDRTLSNAATAASAVTSAWRLRPRVNVWMVASSSRSEQRDAPKGIGMPPSNKTADKSRVESGVGRGSATQAAASPVAPTPSGCEGILARVIQRARVLAEGSRAAQTSASARSRQAAPAASSGDSSADALEQLAVTLRELDPETAIKIRTLMVAGRDGQSIGGPSAISQADAGADLASVVASSGESGALLAEHLLRGHAIACAIGIDLERPIAEWQSRSSDDLDERAWLSFGKQLASSVPDEWQCLAIVEPGTQGLSKLFLKLGDRAWWSFQAQLDRPTLAGVEKERRALARRRLKGIPSNTLEALVGRLGSVQGRALRRASRAICARVGHLSPAT
jgi:hypothetical protein